MPCVHGTILDHDTAAEIFVAGLVGCWLELLFGLVGLAFWSLLCVGLSLKVLGSPVIAIASGAVLFWSYRSALLCAVWVIWMPLLCALEFWYGGCMYRVTGDRSLPGYDAEVRRHPQGPEVLLVRPKPIQAAVCIPAPAILIRCLFGSHYKSSPLRPTDEYFQRQANGRNAPASAPAVAPAHVPPREPSRKEELHWLREERLHAQTAQERELQLLWRLDGLTDMPSPHLPPGHPRLAPASPRQCQPTPAPPPFRADTHQCLPPAADFLHLLADPLSAPLLKPRHPLESGGLPAAQIPAQTPPEWPEVMDICEEESPGTALPPLAPNSAQLPAPVAPFPPQPVLAPALLATPAPAVPSPAPPVPTPALPAPQVPVWIPEPLIPSAQVAPAPEEGAAAPPVSRPKTLVPAPRARRVWDLAPPAPPGWTPGPSTLLAPAPTPLPTPTAQKRKDRASESGDPGHPAAQRPKPGPSILAVRAPGPPRPTAPKPRGLAPAPLARRAQALAPTPQVPIPGPPIPPARAPTPSFQFAGECAAPGFGFGMGRGSAAPGFTFGAGAGPPAPAFGSGTAGPRASGTPGPSTLPARDSAPPKPAALEPKGLAPAPPFQSACGSAAPFGLGVEGGSVASGFTSGAGVRPAAPAFGPRTARDTTWTRLGAGRRRLLGAGGKAGGNKAANKRDHSCLEDSGKDQPAPDSGSSIDRRIIEFDDDLILPELLDLDEGNGSKGPPPMPTFAATVAAAAKRRA